MQKVVYSISKVNRDEKLKGVGYLSEGNLLIPALSSKGKPYTNVPVFKSVDHDSNENKEGSYEVLETIETTYYVWFKKVL